MERGDTGEDELEGEGFNLDGKLFEGRNCFTKILPCVLERFSDDIK